MNRLLLNFVEDKDQRNKIRYECLKQLGVRPSKCVVPPFPHYFDGVFVMDSPSDKTDKTPTKICVCTERQPPIKIPKGAYVMVTSKYKVDFKIREEATKTTKVIILDPFCLSRCESSLSIESVKNNDDDLDLFNKSRSHESTRQVIYLVVVF